MVFGQILKFYRPKSKKNCKRSKDVSKQCCEEKHVDSLFVGVGVKIH